MHAPANLIGAHCAAGLINQSKIKLSSRIKFDTYAQERHL